MGWIYYVAKVRPTEIAMENATYESHKIVAHQIGEPAWPFGYTQVRISLYDESGKGKPTLLESFDTHIANDGVMLRPENCAIEWQDASVKITLSGSEQADAEHMIDLPTSDQQQEMLPVRGELNLQGVSLAQMNRLNMSVIADGENTPTFGFTIGDFIASYNGLYYDDHFDFELPQLSEWEHSTGAGVNGIYEVYSYRFTGDGQPWSLPTMTIRTPLGSAHVQQLTLDFDDHGYTDSLYALYKEKCLYTFKTLFPGREEDELIKLFETVFDKASDPICFVREDDTPMPKVMYCNGQVGLYPYYRSGVIWIDMIPMTDLYVEQLTAQGAELHPIGNESSHDTR